MRFRWPSIAVAFVLGGFLGLSGCGADEDGLDRVRVNMLPMTSFGPLIIAREEGYFRDEGLEIEEIGIKRSAHGIPSLVQGDLDVLCGAISAGVFNAIARGADIRIVADKGHVGSGPGFYTALLTTRSVAGLLDDPSRLRGKRLIANRDNSGAYFTDRALALHGLSTTDLEHSYVRNSARLGAIQGDQTDLVAVSEPHLTKILDTGLAAVWIRDHEVIQGHQYAIVAYGPSLLRERPEVGRRFMRAYLRGVRRYNEGKTERNLEILAKGTDWEPDLLRRTMWPAIRGDGRIDTKTLGPLQTWLLERKFVDRVLEPEEYWDASFVQAAAKHLDGEGGE